MLKMLVLSVVVILSLMMSSAIAWTMEQEIADQVVRKISKLIITQDDLSAFTSGTEQEGVEKIISYLGNAFEEDRRQLQAPQPDHEGLDDTCTYKLCDYLKYQLSCKAIGFDMEKICARYLLGSVLGCKQFPHGHDEVYQAPSVCLQEYLKFLQLISQPANLQKLIQNYLSNDFAENVCGRRCYQNFQTSSNDFFLNCVSQLREYNQSYPLVYGTSNYQQFRNQACSVNSTGSNCYVALSSVSSGSSSVSPFNFTCNYKNNPTINANVLAGFCSTFSKFGCCAASGMQIIFANQQTQPPKIWPPCLMQYFTEGCSTVNLRDYCNNGSMSTQSLFRGTFKLQSTYLHYINVYDLNSVVTAQTILTNVLSGLGLGPEPYNVYPPYPFAVQIIGYTYFDANGNALTPSDGQPAWPSTTDYTNSSSGNFTYQLYLQNLDVFEANHVHSILNSTSFAVGVNVAFGGTQAPTQTTTTGYNYVENTPLDLGSSASTLRSGIVFTVAVALLSAVASLLL